MKIHVTQAGKVIVICVVIGIGIFFMMGGAAIISKIIENHRVNSIVSVPEKFEHSNISYSDYKTLKSSFSEYHAKISKTISELNELHKKYPKNLELEKKIDNYQKYLDSMNNASFDCPEHDIYDTEQRSKTCSNCKGKGKKFFIKTCKNCNGEGKVYYKATISKDCPYCGTIYKSQIHAKALLQ